MILLEHRSGAPGRRSLLLQGALERGHKLRACIATEPEDIQEFVGMTRFELATPRPIMGAFRACAPRLIARHTPDKHWMFFVTRPFLRVHRNPGCPAIL